MSTEYLDPVPRAVNRILAQIKQRCEIREYSSQTEAETALREFIEDEPAVRKRKAKGAASQ